MQINTSTFKNNLINKNTMKKVHIKYFVDLALAISFILVFITGIIKFPRLLFKLGINSRDLPFRTISTIHDYSGILMGIFVLIHIILNWKWITSMTKSIIRKANPKSNKPTKAQANQQ